MADIPEYKPKADTVTPKRGETRASKSKLSADRPFKFTIGQIREALENAAATLVLALSARGDMHCAEVVMDGAPDLINSWIWLAEKQPSVRRVLEYMVGGGGYLALLSSTLAVALPIMQHHGMYPEGAPTPVSLKNLVGNMFADDATSDNGTAT